MMVLMKIEIEGRVIEFDVQYGNGKKLSIHIDAIGFITVKVPKNTSEEIILSTIEHNSKWVLERLNEIIKARQIPKAKVYHSEEKFFYLGKECLLHELIEIGELGEEELRERLKRFYFTGCKKIIGERIKIYQEKLGIKPKSVEIIESKSQWGSCNSNKKINFNYRLVMAPLEIIDYVIVHELCHLIHMNHDRSFWRRVGSVVPDYKKKQEFLDRQGHYMTL